MAIDGSDVDPAEYGGQDIINYVKNSWASASAPANPATGCLWYDDTDNALKVWNGSAWQDAADMHGVAPIGAILPWCPGYFGNGSNGSYANVLGAGNTIAQQNAYLNPLGWYVANGAAVNESASTIWSAASRYLPMFTDSRFVQGDTAILAEAATVGSNTMAHAHPVNPPNTTSGGPSSSQQDLNYFDETVTSATTTHTHNLDIPEFTSDGASDTDNLPVLLGLFPIVRVF